MLYMGKLLEALSTTLSLLHISVLYTTVLDGEKFVFCIVGVQTA